MAEIYNILSTTELDLFMLIQWENLQVVDIAFPVHRVGILIDTESTPFLDNDTVNKELQAMQWAMEENGWQLIMLNYTEFKQNGIEYVEDLRVQLEEVNRLKILKFFKSYFRPTRQLWRHTEA